MFVRGAHAPHFYYLQLKYQFNTIKVMGRIFTAFLFIIIPFVKLFADTDASACDINSACSCFTDSSTCSSAPGCYYVSNTDDEFASGECKACDPGGDSTSGRYGSRCESQCDSITDSSNDSVITDFRFGHQHTINNAANARGARTKYECYKKLDSSDTGTTPETGHGYKCKDPDDQMVNTECREYYRDDDAGATDTATGLAYQGNANYHFVTCDASNVGLHNGDSSGYHMESNNRKCYSNTRQCSLFGIASSDGNQCISSGQTQRARISSNAVLTWRVDSKTWAASLNCKCRVEGDFEEDHCNGFKEFYNTGMVNSSTVSAQLIFRNNSSYGATTHCSGCFAGYYANGDTDNSFNCVPAQQGYYSTGCGTKWTDDNPTESSIPDCTLYSGILKPCYAGMTTSGSGADSVQDCYYTDQTQFCDAWGCTSYSDLVGSNADNWWWYMQSGTTTGGGVNTSIDDIINDPSLYY